MKRLRRRWLLLAIGLTAAALAAWAALRPGPPQPCLAAFEQVRVGMTRAEVAATVGGPPGAYRDGGCVESLAGAVGPDREAWMSPDWDLPASQAGRTHRCT
jgi:hypothetical protein